jgi:hypothetical protein
MVLTRLPHYVGTALPSSTPVGAPRASPAGNDLSAEELVVAYHERTKHHYHRGGAAFVCLYRLVHGIRMAHGND